MDELCYVLVCLSAQKTKKTEASHLLFLTISEANRRITGYHAKMRFSAIYLHQQVLLHIEINIFSFLMLIFPVRCTLLLVVYIFCYYSYVRKHYIPDRRI